MELDKLSHQIIAKLKEPGTWGLVVVVGTVINVYGQLLLPWFRGSFDPPVDFLIELEIRPAVTAFSVFLGFAFPLFVSVYSAITTQRQETSSRPSASRPHR